MKATLAVSYTLPALILASPAKRNCGSQCFNSTNACGVPFGGCWDDCSLGPREQPTLTAPPCTSTPSFPSLTTPTPTPSLLSSNITLAPNNISFLETEICWPGRILCIDYVQFCGNTSHKYGGCDDVCDRKVYTAPACTLPSMAPKVVSEMAGTKTTTSKKAKARPTRGACDKAKSFLCAPMNWRG